MLTSEEYYSRYLGFDDVGAFQALAQDRGSSIESRQKCWIWSTRKGIKLKEIMEAGEVLFPGAADFIRAAAAAVPIAIASGALRHEIDEIVSAAGLAPLFSTIVASGDTPSSKPSPAPYQLAFERLQAVRPDLEAHRCVAIEDSRWGLASAAGAGLRCVGVMTSYGAEELSRRGPHRGRTASADGCRARRPRVRARRMSSDRAPRRRAAGRGQRARRLARSGRARDRQAGISAA